MLQVTLKLFHQSGVFVADGDGDGQESSFHYIYVSTLLVLTLYSIIVFVITLFGTGLLFYQSESQSVEPLSQSSSS